MDKKEISRRDTLNLAKFGLLLAAGLGVVEESVADESGVVKAKALDAGALYVKCYKCDGTNLVLIKTIELPAVQIKHAQADNLAQIMFKVWRPASAGQTETTYSSLSESLLKYPL